MLRSVSIAVVIVCGAFVGVGCRASARQATERTTSIASDAVPGAAGGSPGIAAAPEGTAQRSVISRVLQYSAGALGIATSNRDIHIDDSFANEQAKFLEHDLKVPSLRRRSGVGFANVIQTVEGKRIHIGIVEFPFGECKDLGSAFTALSKLGRDTFNIAALAVFRVLRRENALIILFSETPFHPKVRALLESAAQNAPGSPQCAGR